MIDIKTEVREYLGSMYEAFNKYGHSSGEFAVFNPQNPRELELFYKTSRHYIIDNARHEVPHEIKGWKGRVLDFGGGAGNVAVALLENGCEVDYIDINFLQQDFMRWLKKKHKLDNLHIVEEPTGEYQYMVMRDVVEHLHDYRVVLSKLFKFLKTGGKLFVKPEFSSNSSGDGMAIHFHDKANFGKFLNDENFYRMGIHIYKKQ